MRDEILFKILNKSNNFEEFKSKMINEICLTNQVKIQKSDVKKERNSNLCTLWLGDFAYFECEEQFKNKFDNIETVMVHEGKFFDRIFLNITSRKNVDKEKFSKLDSILKNDGFDFGLSNIESTSKFIDKIYELCNKYPYTDFCLGTYYRGPVIFLNENLILQISLNNGYLTKNGFMGKLVEKDFNNASVSLYKKVKYEDIDKSRLNFKIIMTKELKEIIRGKNDDPETYLKWLKEPEQAWISEVIKDKIEFANS